MEAHDLQRKLDAVLNEIAFCLDDEDRADFDSFGDLNIESIRTFEQAGILTSDAGLVIETSDGREFQLTIVQSR